MRISIMMLALCVIVCPHVFTELSDAQTSPAERQGQRQLSLPNAPPSTMETTYGYTVYSPTGEPLKRTIYGGWEHDKAGEIQPPKTLTKTFLIAHGVWLASNVFDIEMTHEGVTHHRCVEGGEGISDAHPSRSEMYANDGIVFAVGTLFDWVMQRTVRREGGGKAFFWAPYIFAGYGTALHLKGGIDWYSRCW